MEGLRQETNQIRVTTLSPGVTESELGHDITVGDTKTAVNRLINNPRISVTAKPLIVSTGCGI